MLDEVNGKNTTKAFVNANLDTQRSEWIFFGNSRREKKNTLFVAHMHTIITIIATVILRSDGIAQNDEQTHKSTQSKNNQLIKYHYGSNSTETQSTTVDYKE